METKKYYEKVMQDFRSTMSLGLPKNQHRNGHSLRKYCQDEGIGYKWPRKYKKTYPNETMPVWQVSYIRMESSDVGVIDINNNNLAAVTNLLQSLSSPC